MNNEGSFHSKQCEEEEQRIIKAGEIVQNRMDYFGRFGFETLIIWQNELEDEESVVSKIRSFGGD